MQGVAGVDSSTQSTKVELRDIETGAVIARASAPHTATTPPRNFTITQLAYREGKLADLLKAEAQKAAGKPLSADQIALAIQDHKAANVETNFKKSPDAWEGVRGRIADERKVFEKK